MKKSVPKMKLFASVLALVSIEPATAFLSNGPANVASALDLRRRGDYGDRSDNYMSTENDQMYMDATGRMNKWGRNNGYYDGDYYSGRRNHYSRNRRFGGRGSRSWDWKEDDEVTVQGGSLRTWSLDRSVDSVYVQLNTEGRPLNANIDLWHGPDNTPQKMAVYNEDGFLRPFSCLLSTKGGHNAIAVRNTGSIEFPLDALVETDQYNRRGMNDGEYGGSYGRGGYGGTYRGGSFDYVTRRLEDQIRPTTVQGGAIRTYSFAPTVDSVEVLLTTDGRPLNARVELLQGPNNNKQVIELYSEDGFERPFYGVIDTPGVGNVVRVLNTAPVEFPMYARVEPYDFDYRFRGDDFAGINDQERRDGPDKLEGRYGRRDGAYGLDYYDRTSPQSRRREGAGYNSSTGRGGRGGRSWSSRPLY